MEFPEILYVAEETHYLGYSDHGKHLVGSGNLDSRVPDNERETIVGTYKLVTVEKYIKKSTRTSVIEKIND
jgi:hypothetical protein